MIHPPIPKSQRGSVLLIVIVLLFCLTLLGYATMQIVGTDNEVAGNFRRSASALYLAQSGVAWGMDVLAGEPFGVDGDTADFSTVLQTVQANLVSEEGNGLNNFYQLPNSPVAFGDGQYFVGIKDDPDANPDPLVDTNQRILMRAVGKGSDQTQRVIEVTLMVGD